MLYVLPFPRTLKHQFLVVLAVLSLLLVGSGIMAVRTINDVADASRELAEDRLAHLEDGQNLVRSALLVEHNARQMLSAQSADEFQELYELIIERLNGLNRLVVHLGQVGTDVSVLELQRSEQLFRSTVHILAGLRNDTVAGSASPGSGPDPDVLQRFEQSLQDQGTALVTAAQGLSGAFSEDYKAAVTDLALRSERRREQILVLLACTLALIWLVFTLLLGKLVLARLQTVSDFLRHERQSLSAPHIPVGGGDEISEMARAVEAYMKDRIRLADAEREAMQSARFVAVGQLAAGIAHEINTPIQYIGSNLGFIQDIISELHQDGLDARSIEDIREVSDAIKESLEGVRQISSIVSSMKEFSHPGSYEYAATNINQALESSLAVTQNQWKTCAIIERDYDPDLPTPLCKADAINQVFLNLIVNATQAIEESGKPYPGRIKLTTRADDKWVEIRVADTGIGIRSDIRDRVFDPFFTTKDVGVGTGQGLAICHDIIVVKHGGSIEIGGTEGEGAEFIVRLPMTHHKAGDKGEVSA